MGQNDKDPVIVLFKKTIVSHHDLTRHGEEMHYWKAPKWLGYVCGYVYVSYLTLSQVSFGERLFGRPKAQLSADHAGCSHVPQVVTHGTPLPLPQHLNTALPEPGPRLEAHNGLKWKRKSLDAKWKFVKWFRNLILVEPVWVWMLIATFSDLTVRLPNKLDFSLIRIFGPLLWLDWRQKMTFSTQSNELP